jgi:Phage integrase family
VAQRLPEALKEAGRIAAIPTKRAAPPETRFLERDEIEALFRSLPSSGGAGLRDRALLLFLYNTGARVQEVAELCVKKLRTGPGAARSSAWQGRQVANLPVMEGNGPTPPKTVGRSPNFQCARSRLHFGARQAIDAIWNLQNRMSSHSKIAATAEWGWPSRYFTSCVSPFDSCPSARIGRRTQRDSRLAGTRESGNHQSLR